MTKDEWYKQLFERLENSRFRSRFHLKQKDIDYIHEKGLDTIRKHAEDFITKREAPAYIPNDGKQTPMRGHPVFIAQRNPVWQRNSFLSGNSIRRTRLPESTAGDIRFRSERKVYP